MRTPITKIGTMASENRIMASSVQKVHLFTKFCFCFSNCSLARFSYLFCSQFLSTFYMQLLRQSSYAKKLQSQTVIREKLHKLCLYKKGERKMLMKITPGRHLSPCTIFDVSNTGQNQQNLCFAFLVFLPINNSALLQIFKELTINQGKLFENALLHLA